MLIFSLFHFVSYADRSHSSSPELLRSIARGGTPAHSARCLFHLLSPIAYSLPRSGCALCVHVCFLTCFFCLALQPVHLVYPLRRRTMKMRRDRPREGDARLQTAGAYGLYMRGDNTQKFLLLRCTLFKWRRTLGDAAPSLQGERWGLIPGDARVDMTRSGGTSCIMFTSEILRRQINIK